MLSPRIVAIVAGLVATSSLTALVIVVGVKAIDALSTVALALAILAFIIQIIVFIVDHLASGRQLARSEELHGEMVKLLTEIREQSKGTQASLAQIQARVFDDLMAKAGGALLAQGGAIEVDDTEPEPEPEPARVKSASDSPPPHPGVGQSVPRIGALRTLREVIPGAGGDGWPEPSKHVAMNFPPPYEDAKAALIHAELAVWPDVEDYDDINDILGKLSTVEINGLIDVAEDAIRSTAPGSSLGPGYRLTAPLAEALTRHELIGRIPGYRLYTLTPKGRNVARLFTAIGRVPRLVPEDLLKIRRSALSYRQAVLDRKSEILDNRE